MSPPQAARGAALHAGGSPAKGRHMRARTDAARGDCHGRRRRASLANPVDELIQAWTHRRNEAVAIGALAPVAQVCDLVLNDLQTMKRAADSEVLTLIEAARRSGYSREHLGRMVAAGAIPNAGRRNAPRIRVADLPRKPGHLPDQQVDNDIVGASKAAVVRSIANSQKASLR